MKVLAEVLSGRRTVASAAIVLAIGVRQIHRLLVRFREDGGGALIHIDGLKTAATHVPAFVTSTVDEVTGTPARTFLDWATDHAADFGPRRDGLLL